MPRDMPRHRQRPPNGFSQPAMFGDKPPVTIRPTPPRAPRQNRRQFAVIARVIFQARMHRTHEHTVAQRDEAEVERCEQVRVERMRSGVGHGERHQTGV
jgi:hypothetical protein